MSSAKKVKGGSRDGKGSPNKLEVPEVIEQEVPAAGEVVEEDADKKDEENEGDGQSVTNEPEPEPVYEEPILTQLIVENYDGPIERGLYEGTGEASFVGGHKYQGQFSCGLMHGIGKYTWNDGTVYEGEFLQNKITGTGKLLWTDESWYDGEVYEGLRHGIGTFISPKTGMSYEGEWKMGKKHGKGLMKYDVNGQSFYEGSWVDNRRHGLGTCQFPSGNIYQGTWFNNERHGQGTMRWISHNQLYIGQWDRGVQQGYGEHVWFFQRAEKSQYPLRNMYKGQLRDGMRHGFGAFFYANGAVFEGEWRKNQKHGQGKFIFKNGRVYEGIFDHDHILEYPTFVMDGVNTPDMSQIKTRTPLPAEAMSVISNYSRNTHGPSFQLDMSSLMEEFPESDRMEEASQVMFVIMRHMSSLRAVYTFYSKLGYEESPDNTFVMSHMQFWRFLKDIQLHHYDSTLADMDRFLGPDLNSGDDIHNPYSKILFREFINHLVKISYFLFEQDKVGTEPVLAWCFSKLIADHVLKRSCTVKGYVFADPQHSLNALLHVDQAFGIYKTQHEPSKKNQDEIVFTMRHFLFMLKNFKLLDDNLTPKKVIEILSEDDPRVADAEGCVNLELEMTFLEFFEALIGCAKVFTESGLQDPKGEMPPPESENVETAIENGEEDKDGGEEDVSESVFPKASSPAQEPDPPATSTQKTLSPKKGVSQGSQKAERRAKTPETRGSNRAMPTPDSDPATNRKSNCNRSTKLVSNCFIVYFPSIHPVINNQSK